MKKLKLDLDSVQVQSFETTPDAEAPLGTVHGEMITQRTNCGYTCVASCCHTDDMV